jgi:hypothetical protein
VRWPSDEVVRTLVAEPDRDRVVFDLPGVGEFRAVDVHVGTEHPRVLIEADVLDALDLAGAYVGVDVLDQDKPPSIHLSAMSILVSIVIVAARSLVSKTETSLVLIAVHRVATLAFSLRHARRSPPTRACLAPTPGTNPASRPESTLPTPALKPRAGDCGGFRLAAARPRLRVTARALTQRFELAMVRPIGGLVDKRLTSAGAG